MTVDDVANLDLVHASPPHSVSTERLDWRDTGRACCVVDVRTPDEQREMPFRNAQLIPLGALRERAGEVLRDRPVVLLCKQGTRGYEGQRTLQGLGVEDVCYLEGGAIGWPFAD